MRIESGQTPQAYINRHIKQAARSVAFRVEDNAPSTIGEVIEHKNKLVIWSGASDHTIFNDAATNWAFRAIHDRLHAETRLNFTPEQEIELGRIQASKLAAACKSFLADLFYIEVAEQANYYLKNGAFVEDQIAFTSNAMSLRGYEDFDLWANGEK